MSGGCIETRLVRVLAAAAARAGCPLTVEQAHAVRWASVTFEGLRHTLVVSASATDAFDAWLDGLPDADWRIAGAIVVEIAVEAVADDGVTRRVTLGVLTLDGD